MNGGNEELIKKMEEDNVKFVNLQFTDILGIVKSLTIGIESIEECLKRGIWFDGSSIDGFTDINESDMFLKPDISTYAIIPWLVNEDGNTARFICDVHMPNGEQFEGDPRSVLKKVIKEAEELGFIYNTGPELEFFLFEKNNGKLKPLPHDKGGYFDLNMDEAYHVRREINLALKKFGIEVEALHHEVAAGQHEINFKYSNALKTADNAITLKFVVKAIAQKHGLHATFMPKPISGINGSGMHVHQSLSNKDGANLFYDADDPHKLSKTAKNFIAGQLKHVKAMISIISPTVNSYKRLVPGYEAPVYVSWGSRNRSALIRIPRVHDGQPKTARIELRCPDPTANIYLAFAVMLKSGIDGVKNHLEAPKPMEENLYRLNGNRKNELDIEQLPPSLGHALEELKNDEVLRDALGEHTYNQYIETKTKEWDEYRLYVSQWELDKYLEAY